MEMMILFLHNCIYICGVQSYTKWRIEHINWIFNFTLDKLLHTCCTLFSSLRVVDGCLAEEVGDNLSSLTLLKIPVYFSPDAAFASSHSPKGGTATSSSGWIDKQE
jgi:hypothetical protein